MDLPAVVRTIRAVWVLEDACRFTVWSCWQGLLQFLCSCQPFPHFLSVLQLQTLGRLSVRALNWRNDIIHRWRYGACHCISLPFVLPSKASPVSASVAKSAKSLAWNGTEKSVFKQESAGQTMLDLLWSYACVLTSLAVSIMLYCPLLAKNVCMSTFLVQWLLGVQCCLWWLGSVWPSLGFKGNWSW